MVAIHRLKTAIIEEEIAQWGMAEGKGKKELILREK